MYYKNKLYSEVEKKKDLKRKVKKNENEKKNGSRIKDDELKYKIKKLDNLDVFIRN